MTVKFMLLSAPRSGSTWASNWLTTERTLCIHDPILTLAAEEIDSIPCDRVLGVSCTGLALLPGFVNKHPARKVILHRRREEIDDSLLSIGLTPLSSHWDGALQRIVGMHMPWSAIFDESQANGIYQFLTQEPFDAARHRLLLDLHVEPEFDRVHVKADAAKGFAKRVREALHEQSTSKAAAG